MRSQAFLYQAPSTLTYRYMRYELWGTRTFLRHRRNANSRLRAAAKSVVQLYSSSRREGSSSATEPAIAFGMWFEILKQSATYIELTLPFLLFRLLYDVVSKCLCLRPSRQLICSQLITSSDLNSVNGASGFAFDPLIKARP